MLQWAWLKKISTALLEYLNLSIPAPELKEVANQRRDLALTTDFDRLDMPQQWAQTLHDKWTYIGSTIQDYAGLRSQIQHDGSYSNYIPRCTYRSARMIFWQTDMRSLTNWETKIEEWKGFASRAVALLQQLQSELAQKKQSIHDRIVEMRALLRPVMLEYAEEFSNEWDLSVTHADYADMDLESLVSFNTTLEQGAAMLRL